MELKKQKDRNEPATGVDGEYIMTNGGADGLAKLNTMATSTENEALLEQIVEKSNLLRALKRVEKNKGAGGVDGMSVHELRGYLKEHSLELKEQLMTRKYRPQPVRRVAIPKPGGGERDLGIPTVLDRLVQQMVLQVIEPIFEAGFSDSSYGFRPGRSAHQAVTKAKEYIAAGYEYVVDIDLDKFFDRVNHDMLISRVRRKIKDERVVALIQRFLNAGILVNGCVMTSEEGTPQGGPLSPLLSNIMLDDLDKELENRGHKHCRYADDCNIYVRTPRAAGRVLTGVSDYITRKLKLRINKAKSGAAKANQRKFLSFSFSIGKEIKICVAEVAWQRCRDKLRQLTRRVGGISMDARIAELNKYLPGWIHYFALADRGQGFERTMSWLRRRLRQCLLRQCRSGRTRYRLLVAAGLSHKWAKDIAGSSKSVWRLAHTMQMDFAFNNAYWRRCGLIDIPAYYQLCRSRL